MIGSDLTNLFRAPGGGESFRQGTIVTFNPASGANSVNVGGAVLANLPLVNASDVVNYTAGDVVVLLKFRSSWAIMGRVIVPGGTDLASASVGFDSTSATGSSYTIDTFGAGGLTKATATINVPSWANQAAVLALAICVGKQPTSPVVGSPFMTTSVKINGDTDTGKPQGWVEAANHVVSAYPNLSRVITVTPGGTFPVTIEVWADANWGSNSSNYTRLQVQTLFRKV